MVVFKNPQEANFPISSIISLIDLFIMGSSLFLFTSQLIAYLLFPSLTSLGQGTWHFRSSLI